MLFPKLKKRCQDNYITKYFWLVSKLTGIEDTITGKQIWIVEHAAELAFQVLMLFMTWWYWNFWYDLHSTQLNLFTDHYLLYAISSYMLAYNCFCYTPRFNEVERGVYWFHLVRLSVCWQNRVRSVSSTILIGSISYLHILSSNFRRCVTCNVF